MATAFAHGNDLCLTFFGLAWPKLFDFNPGSRVLEIGCAEADWLTPMKAARPDLHLTGIDWRACKRPGADVLIKGNVLEQAFERGSCDAVVLVSALEHLGLGHYEQDPGAIDGDAACMRLIWQWLKPGGFVYFDVPWNPDPGYRVLGTETRVYDDAALNRRLAVDPWTEQHRRYVDRVDTQHTKEELHFSARRPDVAHDRFHYVACLWSKPIPVEYLG